MAAPTDESSWYAEVSEFKRDAAQYLSSKKISVEHFVLDILQGLYLEEATVSCKLLFLSLLQEHSDILLQDNESVEQVVGSLRNVFIQLQADDQNSTYKGQLLVTMTTILISTDQLSQNESLFISVVDLLLVMMSHVNRGADKHLRGTACRCLCELELSYPGVLGKKLDHIFRLCQQEYWHCFQDYVLLFSTVLAHALQRLPEVVPSDCITRMLNDRTELLKPLILPGDAANAFHLCKQRKDWCLASHLDMRELRRALLVMLDMCDLLTSQARFMLLHQLTDVVRASGITPMIFQTIMMKYLVTIDVPLLNLLLMWKTMFADDLFADAEETYLYTRLLRDGHHQSLPITQRLLCLHWLEQFIEVSPLAASMQSQQHHLLVPTALDSSDLRLQKLRILTACYDDSSDVDTRLLISSLGIQRKLVHYSQSGKYGPALFRVLYTYFSRHPGTELAAEVCRFVEVLVQAEPFLMPHVLDFLKCVQKTEVQGSCYHQMLLCILEQVTQHDMAVVQENLSYHLMLLKEAAAQPSVSSQKIIQLLLSVCESTPILTEGDLLVGHQLIGVCRSLLQTHPTRDMFEELADLLHTVFTRSNDVGIQSKAKFYYAMLVKLPDSQIKDLLVKAPSTGSDSWKSMANLMSEDVSIPERVCVIKFDNPILQLTRKTESLDKSFRLAVAVDSRTGDDSTLFTRYITSMKSAVLPSVEIPASLTFPPNQDAVKRFYAGILTIDRDEDYEAIAEYIVVYMDAAAMPSHDILLTFTPLRPSPTSFRLRFTFTDMEGRTCLSMLSPFQLRFDDLFLPLPIIDGAACNKLQLFNCLWQSFYNVCSFNTDPSCASSIVVLMLPQEQMMSILSADLKEYVIALEYEECVSVGIVLPPSSHVLFKMVIEAEKTIVHIATDNWEILPMINHYLLDMQATGKPADS